VSCSAILGISDPVDEGAAPTTDGSVDGGGVLDGVVGDGRADSGGVDSRVSDGTPGDGGDSFATPPDTTPVETSVDCAASADGILCALSPRAICLHGTCQVSRCGDGFTDDGRSEECDDANFVDGDGCDGDCKFSCNSSDVGKTCGLAYCTPKTCSGHACVAGASPCGPPPLTCDTVHCDEASRSCPVSLTDADGDGHGPSSSPAAAPCNDCNDADPDTFGGQTKWFTSPRAGGGFDYDCSGVEEPEFTDSGSCDYDPVTMACDFTPGWAGGTPACGVTGDTIAGCIYKGISAECTPTIGSRVEACH
jgi:cysteine-rich repeat protein